MTTSDYCNVQSDLLIAYRLMRRARVEEALRLARAAITAGRPLVDQFGRPIADDPERTALLCEAVLGLLEKTGRDVIPRKPPASDPGELAAAKAVGA